MKPDGTDDLCPFCGGEVEVTSEQIFSDGMRSAIGFCYRCRETVECDGNEPSSEDMNNVHREA